MRSSPAEGLTRRAIISVMALMILAPIALIAYQSFLTAPFFDPKAEFRSGPINSFLQNLIFGALWARRLFWLWA